MSQTSSDNVAKSCNNRGKHGRKFANDVRTLEGPRVAALPRLRLHARRILGSVCSRTRASCQKPHCREAAQNPQLPKLEQQKLASDSVYTSRKKQEATTNVTNIERQCCSTTQPLPPPPSATTVDTTNTTAPTAEAADNLSDEVADTILQSPTPTKCYYC
jgi:hypothetical protein